LNFKTISVYALGMGGSACLSLVTFPVLAWFYSPEDIGRISMLQVICSLVVLFFSLGLDQAYVREFNETNDKARLTKTIFWPGFILLITTLGVLTPFFKEITSFLFDEQELYIFLLFSCALVFLYLERYFSVFLRMKEYASAYSLTKVVSKALFLTLICIVYFDRELARFSYLAMIQVISWFATILVMIFFLKDEISWIISSRVEKNKLLPLLQFSYPLVLSSAAFWGLSSLDRLMLKSYASFAELGVYSIAVSLAGTAALVQQFFSILWLPTIYKWVSKGVELDKVQKIASMTQLLSFVLIPLVGLLSWIVALFLPENYQYLHFILAACMIGPLFMMVSEVTGIGISIVRKTKYLSFVSGFSLIVNAFLNYFLIPNYGARGAATATAISFYIFLLLKTEVSSRIWRSVPRLRMYACSTIMVFISACFALFGQDHMVMFFYIWAGSILLMLFLYRDCFNGININFSRYF